MLKKSIFGLTATAFITFLVMSLPGCGGGGGGGTAAAAAPPAATPSGPASTFNEVYVANRSTGVISVYARTASGVSGLLRTITYGQPATGNWDGIAVDKVNNEIYTMNESNSIYVVSRTASGVVSPLRTISGASTTLAVPVLLTVDSTNNELVVANFGATSIITFPRAASGNVAPIRTLKGAATLLSRPEGVTVNPVTNELIVGNNSAAGITIYPRTANGNVAPTRQITTATNAVGVVVDYINNEIIEGDQNSISVFALAASGAVAPLRTVATGGFGVALDNTNNEIWGSNLFANNMVVYSRTASGVPPLRTINTTGQWGIATY